MNLRILITVMLAVLLTCYAGAQDRSAPRGGGRGGPSISGGRGGPPGPSSLPAASTTSSRPQFDPRTLLDPVEARFREIDENQLKNPPQRDYKVETGQPQKRKLFRADPKLLANKFVVQMEFAPPDASKLERFGVRDDDLLPKEVRELVWIVNGRDGSRRLSDVFLQLAERCPEQERPQAALAYLTSAEFEREHQSSSRNTFALYAPTQKDGEARAAAIVRLYDCGLSRPLQRYFLAAGRQQLAAARASCDEYETLTEQIAAEEQKLAKPSEISPDILSELKAQRVMVAVELAGLNARVKACDAMLNEPQKLPINTLQSISDMKVKAEIERIGTQEKLDRINAFISEGDKRDAIQKQIDTLKIRRTTVARNASYRVSEADHHARLVEYFAPRELEGNAITISPVEWTE